MATDGMAGMTMAGMSKTTRIRRQSARSWLRVSVGGANQPPPEHGERLRKGRGGALPHMRGLGARIRTRASTTARWRSPVRTGMPRAPPRETESPLARSMRAGGGRPALCRSKDTVI